MKKQKHLIKMYTLVGLLLLTTDVLAQSNNFYVYLCFGQSNMEGWATIQAQDQTVDSRFQVMQAINPKNSSHPFGYWV